LLQGLGLLAIDRYGATTERHLDVRRRRARLSLRLDRRLCERTHLHAADCAEPAPLLRRVGLFSGHAEHRGHVRHRRGHGEVHPWHHGAGGERVQ
jgi:hypothetical protein